MVTTGTAIRRQAVEPDGGSRRPSGMRRPQRLLPLCLILIAACSAAPATSGPSTSAAAGEPGANGAVTPSAAPSLSLASPGPTKIVGDLPGAGALFTGILSMDSIEGGCPFLQAADGRRLEVIYPEGWKLQRSPLELIAPDDSVHSRAGDTVSVRGAEAGDLASICQMGPIIRATEVLDR